MVLPSKFWGSITRAYVIFKVSSTQDVIPGFKLPFKKFENSHFLGFK